MVILHLAHLLFLGDVSIQVACLFPLYKFETNFCNYFQQKPTSAFPIIGLAEHVLNLHEALHRS